MSYPVGGMMCLTDVICQEPLSKAARAEGCGLCARFPGASGHLAGVPCTTLITPHIPHILSKEALEWESRGCEPGGKQPRQAQSLTMGLVASHGVDLRQGQAPRTSRCEHQFHSGEHCFFPASGFGRSREPRA